MNLTKKRIAKLHILQCVLLLFILIPLVSNAFTSFPTKIDTKQERINLQAVLNTVMVPSPNLKVDGVLGKKSIQAIQAFQEWKGLIADGKVGPITRTALESSQNTSSADLSQSSTINNIYTGSTISNQSCPVGALYNSQTGKLCNLTTTALVSNTPSTKTSTGSSLSKVRNNINTSVSSSSTTPTTTTPTTPATCSGATSTSCSITNGTGTQSRTCNNGTWVNSGSCNVSSCNSGYQISGNSCVLIPATTTTTTTTTTNACTGSATRSCDLFTTANVLGANKFSNGNFSNNDNGVYCWNDVDNCNASWISSKLDSGTLQVSFDSQIPSASSLLTIPIGSVSSGKNYVLKYSFLGMNNSGHTYDIYLRQQSASYNFLTSVSHKQITSSRTENEITFSSPISDSDAAIIFEIYPLDSTNNSIWIDNVELSEVTSGSVVSGQGTQTRVCSANVWSDYGACTSSSNNTNTTPTTTTPTTPATCSGATSTSCSITNGTGTQSRTCNNGTWVNSGSCNVSSCNSGYQISGNSCVLIPATTTTTGGVTYYISQSTGNDSYTSTQAQNSATPWKTIAKVNSVTFSPGDSILFKKGDIWKNETLIISSSGTSAKPITFGAYGSGSKPVISGFETITNWTSLSGGIYSATTSASNSLNMVTVNGINTAKGRYPNTSYLSFESHSGTTSITDNQLSSSPNWTGAEVVVRVAPWVWEVRKINSHSGTTLTFPALGSYEPGNGGGYFIQNDTKALDLPGEWSIKDGKIYMYFGSNNPSSYVVNASVKDELINSSGKNYIVIDGLAVNGGNKYGIDILWNSNSNTIKNCDVSLSGGQGINSFSASTTIDSCNIHEVNGSGVVAEGDYASIKNNTLENIALFEGMGSLWRYDGMSVYGDNSTVEYNTIKNVGYNGIIFLGNNIIIRNNLIDTFCKVLTDGGGVYTYGSDNTGRAIRDNIIINGVSNLPGSTLTEKATNGVYLDEKSENVIVERNTIANMEGYGIFLHSARNNDIKSNTVYNSSITQLVFSHNTSASNQSGINVLNNILVSKDASQLVFRQYSEYNDYLFGSANGNIYARPVSDTNTISIENYSTYHNSSAYHDLSWWKTFSGYDSSSTKSPVTTASSNNLLFDYNATSSSKTISLGSSSYVDMSGVVRSGSVTLSPFTSIILIKQ